MSDKNICQKINISSSNDKGSSLDNKTKDYVVACCSATKGRKTDKIAFTGEKYRLRPVIGTSHS